MSFRTFRPDKYSVLSVPYSPIVVVDGLVVLSGQVPLDQGGRFVGDGFAIQVDQVYVNIVACLAKVGCALTDVFKTTVFLSDFSDIDEYNELHRQYFSEPFPARTTVQVGLNGMRVEIEVWAKLPVGGDDDADH